MKTVLALCLFAATAAAQMYGGPAAPMVSSYGGTYGKVLTTPIPILKFDQTIRDNGHDSLYETGNGIKNQETTDLVQGPAREVIDEYGQKVMSSTYVKKSGSYSYTNADGTVTAISYTADENGFHPVGDHLPVAPQVPAEYAKPVRAMQQYAAPQSYEAPAVRMQSSYEAPAVRTQSSYAPSAPVQSMRFNYAT